MSRSLEKRLEKRLQELEAKIAQRRRESTQNLVRLAIGHYLGGLQPNEEPGEAIARGLGYKDFCELGTAYSGNNNDFFEKWRQAVRRLFAQFGVDLDGDQKGLEGALKRMKAGLSVSFQEEFWRSEESR